MASRIAKIVNQNAVKTCFLPTNPTQLTLIGKAVQLLLQVVKQRHVVLRIHKHHLPQPLEELEHLHLPLAGRRRHLQPARGPTDRRQRNQLRDVGALAHLQLNVLQLMHQHVHLPRQFLALQTLRTDARRGRIEQTLFAPDALVTDLLDIEQKLRTIFSLQQSLLPTHPMILDLAALDAITADVNLAQVLAPVFPRGLLVVRAVVQRELVALVDVAAGTRHEQAVRDHAGGWKQQIVERINKFKCSEFKKYNQPLFQNGPISIGNP